MFLKKNHFSLTMSCLLFSDGFLGPGFWQPLLSPNLIVKIPLGQVLGSSFFLTSKLKLVCFLCACFHLAKTSIKIEKQKSIPYQLPLLSKLNYFAIIVFLLPFFGLNKKNCDVRKYMCFGVSFVFHVYLMLNTMCQC